MKITIAMLLATIGASAVPAAQAVEYEEFGRVTRVEPRVERVRQPREECRTEYIQAQVQQAPQQQRSAGGAILGAVAGGIIGNQVGGGSGRAAATALGAVAGAVAGDRISNNGAPPARGQQYSEYPQEQAVRQCRVIDSWESRTVGYDVTYNYGGRSYTSIMDRDPGDRIRLRVSVEPDPRQ